MSEMQSNYLAKQLKCTLEETFQPIFLNLENESHLHRTPMHAETHFKCIMVSHFFEGLSPVKRHQAVFKAIAFAKEQGLHAFSMHLFTESEWEKASTESFSSPACQHSPVR
jgi:BolA family transcriptional regulator, general stress-responsive regulator